MTDTQILHAYRHLYRGLLHAVQFSKPARYTARNQLRRAFREEGAKYNFRVIARTLRFLDAAKRERGLEHRVLKNLLYVAWHRYDDPDDWKHVQIIAGQKKTPLEDHVRETAYKHYDMTIAMLNKTLGLSLR